MAMLWMERGRPISKVVSCASSLKHVSATMYPEHVGMYDIALGLGSASPILQHAQVGRKVAFHHGAVVQLLYSAQTHV